MEDWLFDAVFAIWSTNYCTVVCDLCENLTWLS